MKLIYFLSFSLLLVNSLSAQADKNYTQANAILQKAIAKQGGSSALLQPSKYRLEGTRHFFGHYDTPEKTKPIGDTVKIVFIPEVAANYYYSSVNYYGKRTEITLNHKDSTYYMGYFADATEKGFMKERMLIYATSPTQMLQLALKYQKTLHWVGKNKTQEIITFTDNIGECFNLHIDKKSNLLMQVTQLVYDEQYGDTYNEVNYEYANLNDIRPTKLIKKEHGIIESEYRYVDFKTDVVADTNFVKYVCPSCKIEKSKSTADIAIEKIDNNLWIAKLNDLDNKALIAEFNDYLTVMEAPNSAKVCSDLIAAIKLKFPTKPIKLLALSHHHPDHAGGLVAFTNQNVPIMTTKGNIPFFEKLLKTKHTIISENNPTTPKATFNIVDAKSYQVVTDESNQFIAYEAGETTDHVQEFLYFYFPKQKVLFVGDLVMFPKGELRQQRKRAYSVYQLIKEKKLNVEKIYTAWPLKDQKEFGTLQDLKDSLKKNYPDLEKN